MNDKQGMEANTGFGLESNLQNQNTETGLGFGNNQMNNNQQNNNTDFIF